ncbi:hypothetical protein EV121DRAFT_256976 [Schizophyllum commune]
MHGWRVSSSLRAATLSQTRIPRRQYSLSAAADDASASSSSSAAPSTGDSFFDTKMAELNDAISKQRSSAVWLHYANLIDTRSGGGVPLDVHRAVLRACAPPPAALRAWSARRQAAEPGASSRPTSHYESRFRAVLRNIRAAGAVPQLDDYHVVLAQFAAVGNDVGALAVYRELLSHRLDPSSRTYGLVLQAVAHGLTLPEPPENRASRLQRAREIQSTLLADMQTRGQRLRTVNFDLMLRVLKEVEDIPAFARLLRWGYGIDLDNPDHLAPEYQQPTPEELADKTRLAPHRFSTALLNTTVDLLGRAGDISRMIAAFEVLTRPLPAQAPQFYSSTFDEEDDFGPDDPRSQSPPSPRVPCARANTTTYTLLVRHAARAKKTHLVRHYAQEALTIDVAYMHLLKSRLGRGHVPSEFRAPRVSATRDLLYAALGLANKNKDTALARWVQAAMARAIRSKKRTLAWFEDFREKVQEERWQAREARVAKEKEEQKIRRAEKEAMMRAKAAKGNGSASTSTAPSPIHARSTNSNFNPDKRLDLDVQIELLGRDIEELRAAHEDVSKALARIRTRVLERGGRRVWAGQDVFVRDAGKRTVVSKEKWASTVKFPKGATGVRVKIPRSSGGAKVIPGMWESSAPSTSSSAQAQSTSTSDSASLAQSSRPLRASRTHEEASLSTPLVTPAL